MKLVLDDHTLHTKTVDNTLAPTWEQGYKFPCDDACVGPAVTTSRPPRRRRVSLTRTRGTRGGCDRSKVLKLHVESHEMVFKNKFLGMVQVPVQHYEAEVRAAACARATPRRCPAPSHTPARCRRRPR